MTPTARLAALVTSVAVAAVSVTLAVTAAVTPAAAAPGSTLERDFDGDGHADVVLPRTDGALLLYSGNGSGAFERPRVIGSGWGGLDQVLLADDFDGDSHVDVLARARDDGALWLYSGDGAGGWLGWRTVGTGWDVFDQVLTPGDWDGDGHADVVAVRADSYAMVLYPGNGRGGFERLTVIGSGWQTRDALTPTGDFDGDGHPDLLARDTGSGNLWLYSGNGTGGWRGWRTVGTGWDTLTALQSAGDWDGDGDADVLARTDEGRLRLYAGDGRGGLSLSRVYGRGWNGLRMEGGTAFRSSVATVSAVDLPHSYRAGCPVSAGDLRMMSMTYRGFDGVRRTGSMVVHEDHTGAVGRVFERLHDAGFPIARMVPVDAYRGDDDASMAANNTSAFNCRRVTGGSGWSEHSYGAAVDINPVQNPYVNGGTVLPPAGRAYLDRGNARAGMIRAGDVVTRAFAAQGWDWGGDYRSLKDYQHFSRSGG